MGVKNGMKRVSQKDVAGVAGVSQAVVSQVLSGAESNIRISDETIKRVRDAVQELGYQPDHAARVLRTRRTQTIGVVVPSSGDLADRLKAAEAFASENGYELLLGMSRWGTRGSSDYEAREIQRLLQRQVDGLLILSPTVDTRDHRLLESMAKEGIPVVGYGPTLAEGVDYVDWDRVAAYRQITEHLLERGCRRFAFLGRTMTPGVEARLAGVREALVHVNGVNLNTLGCRDHFEGVPIDEMAVAVRDEVVGIRPDAVICQSDNLALAAMSMARGMGWGIPHDMAVTGCSNAPFGRVLDVPLTTVAMPYERLVEAALTRLIERVQEPDHEFERLERLVPADVIFRQSSNL